MWRWAIVGVFMGGGLLIVGAYQYRASHIPLRSEIWRMAIGGEVEQSPAVTEEGDVVVASEGGDVVLIAPEGREMWRTKLHHESIRSSPVIHGHSVYVGDEGGYVYSLSQQTGAIQWERRLDGAVRATVAIDPKMERMYVATRAQTGYALDFFGNVAWKVNLEGPSLASPAISMDGVVYYASDAGVVVAVRNGEEIWRKYFESAIFASPVIDGNRILIGEENGTLTMMRHETGSIEWSWQAPKTRAVGRGIESSPLVMSDGTIIVASKNHWIYALHEGKLQWAVELGWEIESSPMIGDQGTIYVGAEDNYLYAISREGRILWRVVTEGQVDSSPTIQEGVVYFGSSDGNLYAVRADDQGVARTPWPKFHQNSLNTGYAGI